MRYLLANMGRSLDMGGAVDRAPKKLRSRVRQGPLTRAVQSFATAARYLGTNAVLGEVESKEDGNVVVVVPLVPERTKRRARRVQSQYARFIVEIQEPNNVKVGDRILIEKPRPKRVQGHDSIRVKR